MKSPLISASATTESAPGVEAAVAALRREVDARPRSLGVQLGAKRVIDVVLGSAVLLLFLPFGLLIAAAVKLGSKGPVFFRQERVGQGGRLFTIVKFRTMVVDAEQHLKANEEAYAEYVARDFKLDGRDPRITKVGRFLRRTSLDEVPQLFNVLAGHMSLVGVRPLLAPEVAVRSVHDQRCYAALKPGMTGLWQVKGRSKISHVNRYELDRRYVEAWSLWSDLKILAVTPIAVLLVHRSK